MSSTREVLIEWTRQIEVAWAMVSMMFILLVGVSGGRISRMGRLIRLRLGPGKPLLTVDAPLHPTVTHGDPFGPVG